MSVFAVIAQMAGDMAGAVSPLYAYGPLGVITGFFMIVFYRITVTRDAELMTAMKTLAHDMEGVRRAMLVEILERESASHRAKTFANREIAKIDARNSEAAKR